MTLAAKLMMPASQRFRRAGITNASTVRTSASTRRA